MKVSVIITLLTLINVHLYAKAQDEKKPTILFAPNWKVNTTVVYKGEIQRSIKRDDYTWTGQYTSNQTLTVKAKTDSSYTVNWEAAGFPINVFQEFPGPMYDWFQEWSEGKKLNLKIRFSNLGVPVAVENIDSVRSFYQSMVDEFLKELASRDVSPLNKDRVKQSLLNMKTLVIPSDAFPQVFISNFNLLFPLYGKTFFANQNEKITDYRKLPTMGFAVPIQIHTQLSKKPNNIYQLTSNQAPLPYDKWRIRPSGYSSIDFDYTDSLDFQYDAVKQWINYAKHSMNFHRNNFSDNFTISYTKVN